MGNVAVSTINKIKTKLALARPGHILQLVIEETKDNESTYFQ